MNKTFGSIVGNTSITSYLSSSINGNSLSHAYILEGAHGSGRHTVALQTVAAMCCAQKGVDGADIPCKKCLSCRKIFENKSPDIYNVGLEGDRVTIGVEAVRFLKNDIYLPPTDLPLKVYIINDADAMTPQAQNAFLLSLEEPPEYILFFLICENSSALLETIKSRAPTLRTERLSHEQVNTYLLEHDKRAKQLKDDAPEGLSELIFASDGSIGYALELLDTKKRKSVFDDRRIAKAFIELASGKHNRDKLELIFSLGTKRNDICTRLSYIQHAARDLIALKKSEEVPLCFYSDRECACELSTHFTSKGLLALYTSCEAAKDDLARNANVKLTLINMLKNSNLI